MKGIKCAKDVIDELVDHSRGCRRNCHSLL